jgi:hypothetical protein
MSREEAPGAGAEDQTRTPADQTAPDRSTDEAQPMDSPRRQHGDALRDGTGTRHGVRERDQEPDTCR